MKMIQLIENRIFSKRAITIKLIFCLLILSLTSCRNVSTADKEIAAASVPCQLNSESALTESSDDGFFKALKSKSPVEIDGCNKDSVWSKVNWYSMDYIWMGNEVDKNDYQGRFKLAWDSNYLYVLVEVIDEKLNPTLANGMENYWKGDYVEVFIDEDKSGGNHQFNHQAFAYHVSTEGHAIDKNTLQETVFFDDHVEVQRSQVGNTYLWEMAIQIFDDGFDENATSNIPIKITAQKIIGFSIAYGDNDGNNSRENFMGSKKTHGDNNDEGYVNSDVFGTVLFLE